MSSFAIANDQLNTVELNSVVPTPNLSLINAQRIDPVIKTAAFSVSDSYDTYLFDGVTANSTSLTVTTLPAPSASNISRVLHFRSVRTGGGLASASSNVTPITSQTVGSILISTGHTAGSSASVLSTGDSGTWKVIRSFTAS